MTRSSALLLSAALLGGCQSTDQQVNYGLNHYRMGLYNQAIPPLRSAAATLEKESPLDPRLPEIFMALGEMAADTKRPDLAEGFYNKALKAADALATPDENAQRNVCVSAGNFYLAQKRAAEAVPLLERAVRISERNTTRFPRTLHAIDLDNLGQAYSYLGRQAEGRAMSARALKVLDGAKEEKDAAKTRGVVLYNLGYGFWEEQRYAEAEANYRRALEILAPSSGPQVGENWRVRTVLGSYAELLRKLGREPEAAALDRRREGLKDR